MNTPRTDEAQYGTGRVSVDFARQLETELAIMTALADKLAEALEGLVAVNKNHNEALSKLIGKTLGWKDAYLDDSSEALSAYENHKQNTP